MKRLRNRPLLTFLIIVYTVLGSVFLHFWSSYALLAAASHDNLFLTRLLVTLGANVNVRDNNYEPAIVSAARSNDYSMAEYLLDHQAQVDLKAGDQTALLVSVLKDNVVMAQLLLDHGANPSLIDGNANPLLAEAVNTHDYKLVKLLIDYKSDVTGYSGAFAVDSAPKGSAMEKMLLDAGAKPGLESQ